MKLAEYAELLLELAKKHPDYEVWTASDDEGNDFNKLHYPPEVRYRRDDVDYGRTEEMHDVGSLEEIAECDDETLEEVMKHYVPVVLI